MRTLPNTPAWGRRGVRGRRRSPRTAVRACGYWIVRHHAWLAAAAFGFAIADSAYAQAVQQEAAHYVALVALLGLVALRIASRLWPTSGGLTQPKEEERRRDDLSLGLLLVVTIQVVVQMTGGPTSPWHPLTYLFVTFTASFAEPVAMGIIVLALLMGEGLSAYGAGLDNGGSVTATVHGLYILMFSASSWVFLKAQRVLQTRQHARAVEAQLEQTLEEARQFKLVASPLTRESRTRPREEEERVQLREAVESIRRTVRSVLGLLRDAYGLHSCALYWLDESGRLKLREALSGSDVFDDRVLQSKEGLPGTAFTRGEPVRVHGLKADDPRLPYYLPSEHVFAFVAVPVRQGKRCRGVLVGDRRTSLAFTEENERVFVKVGSLIADAVDNERVFIETERAKDAQERFHRAVKALNHAQGAEDAYATAIAAVDEIATYDFAALTALNSETGLHRVQRAEGIGAEELAGLEFGENNSLVAQVTRTNHYLPIAAKVGDRRLVVFTPDVGPADMESLIVLPLEFGGDVVATLTLASRQPGAYPMETRAQLEVVTSAAAVSLVNARNYQTVEALATTDPLTGLFNRRLFSQRLTDMLARSRRGERPMSLILCDLDHFKRINDTFGHSAGDEVLRRAARTLQDCVRETDVVARYGGEEFAILLEEADCLGGSQMAERIRAAVAELVVETEGHRIEPTISAGCATWEAGGPETQAVEIIDQADRSLYRAKALGRDRIVHFRDMGLTE